MVRITSGVSTIAKKGSIANIYNRQGSLDAIKQIKEKEKARLSNQNLGRSIQNSYVWGF